MGKLENKFKTHLKHRLESTYPGCIITYLDPNDIQGIPDMLILYEHMWATLEGKKDQYATKQPNQPYYVDLMNRMSFSAFIFPENEEEVLEELYLFFTRN